MATFPPFPPPAYLVSFDRIYDFNSFKFLIFFILTTL